MDSFFFVGASRIRRVALDLKHRPPVLRFPKILYHDIDLRADLMFVPEHGIKAVNDIRRIELAWPYLLPVSVNPGLVKRLAIRPKLKPERAE